MKSFTLIAGVATLLAPIYAASEPYPEAAIRLRDQGLKPLVQAGCFTSVGNMVKSNTYIYQTQGSCQEKCVSTTGGVRHPVLAVQGQDCYCGDGLPETSAKTDNGTCSTICPGYRFDMCGGPGAFTVWLTSEPMASDANANPPPATTTTPPVAASTTSGGSASTVTKDGQTIVVTAPAQTNSSDAPKSSGGSNKTAIAVGVVVGFVLIAAIAAGAFLFLRHRRRRQIEEEYQRNAAVSSFISGGKSPSTTSAGNSFNDPRIDPAVLAQRRMSDGSIADNQDYSRRILKVTNA